MQTPKHNTGISPFLSGITIALSILACLFSGFTLYKLSSTEQKIETLSQTIATLQTAQSVSAQKSLADANTPVQEPLPSPSESPIPTSSTPGIQPGQFVQTAFGDKAKVELLTVKRIKDPETGTSDVVNVQFRARRLARSEESNPYGWIFPRNVKARNPDTSETYAAVSSKRATESISLNSVKYGASLDAYVWLKVPESANTLDIYIPETQVFKNVPVSN